VELVEQAVTVKDLTDQLGALHFFDRPNIPHFVGRYVVSVGDDNTVVIRSYIERTTYGLRRYAEVKDGEINVIEYREITEHGVKSVLKKVIAQLS
jgi:hypothetical protein